MKRCKNGTLVRCGCENKYKKVRVKITLQNYWLKGKKRKPSSCPPCTVFFLCFTSSALCLPHPMTNLMRSIVDKDLIRFTISSHDWTVITFYSVHSSILCTDCWAGSTSYRFWHFRKYLALIDWVGRGWKIQEKPAISFLIQWLQCFN